MASFPYESHTDILDFFDSQLRFEIYSQAVSFSRSNAGFFIETVEYLRGHAFLCSGMWSFLLKEKLQGQLDGE